MKKKVKIIIICLMLLAILIAVVVERDLIKKADHFLFYLEEKYYGDGTFIEIDSETLQFLIDSKESFSIFIHQSFCSTSYEFNKVLAQFSDNQQISFYKINFEDMQKTDLGKNIEYYPSFAIYNEGKLVDFLRADKDEDLEYYKSADKFENWFSKYVILEKTDYSEELRDE